MDFPYSIIFHYHSIVQTNYTPEPDRTQIWREPKIHFGIMKNRSKEGHPTPGPLPSGIMTKPIPATHNPVLKYWLSHKRNCEHGSALDDVCSFGFCGHRQQHNNHQWYYRIPSICISKTLVCSLLQLPFDCILFIWSVYSGLSNFTRQYHFLNCTVYTHVGCICSISFGWLVFPYRIELAMSMVEKPMHRCVFGKQTVTSIQFNSIRWLLCSGKAEKKRMEMCIKWILGHCHLVEWPNDPRRVLRLFFVVKLH